MFSGEPLHVELWRNHLTDHSLVGEQWSHIDAERKDATGRTITFTEFVDMMGHRHKGVDTGDTAVLRSEA